MGFEYERGYRGRSHCVVAGLHHCTLVSRELLLPAGPWPPRVALVVDANVQAGRDFDRVDEIMSGREGQREE